MTIAVVFRVLAVVADAIDTGLVVSKRSAIRTKFSAISDVYQRHILQRSGMLWDTENC